MKKLFVIFLAGVFASCTNTDPISENHYVWTNNSEYEITFSSIGYGVSFEDEVISSKESFAIVFSNFGETGKAPETIETMTVGFDDGVRVVYGGTLVPVESHIPNVFYDQPFNPTWEENYEYKKLGRYEYQWTYTFTNADYEAAKAIVEGE